MKIEVDDENKSKMILDMDMDTAEDVCIAMKLIHLFIMGWDLQHNEDIELLFIKNDE